MVKKTFVLIAITFFDLVFTAKILIFPTFILVLCSGELVALRPIKMWKNKELRRARE